MLCPECSNALRIWWCLLHALPAAAVLLSALPPLPAIAITAALLINGAWRFPRQRPPVLLRRRDGNWSLPRQGRMRLTLASGSMVAWQWVRLVLTDGRCRHVVLLLRDQVDAETWRALQARLRHTF